MSNTTMIALIQELMGDYDSSIDTSNGSAFYVKVITPLLVRIGDDPLNTDVEELVAAHLEENIEGIEAGEGSGVRDLIARPLTVGMEPWKRELLGVKTASSLNNYASMSRDEVNALLGNFFLELKEGEKAKVTGRLYFSAAQSVVVTPLTQFSTGSGLNFFPTTTQTITSTSMSFNQEGSFYYFDVTLEAELAGEDYSVDAGSIISVVGIAGVVKVTNKSAAAPGKNDETKLEGITRAKDSITIRNLSVLRGVKTVLQAEYSSIDDIEVVGMGDPLMLRDVITGPVDISDIPGGYVGSADSLVGSGNKVHIGGKTDIWLFTTSPVEESLDIENVTDQGIQVWEGKHGYTNPGSATSTFRDEYGRFTSRGVLSGDILRIGEREIEISSRTETTLSLAETLDPALSEQVYEIVRKFDYSAHHDGEPYLIAVPLWNLVAVDADGAAVTDDDGDPVVPIPGDPDLGAYEDDGGDYVKVEENIAAANLSLPLVRVKKIEFLDSLDLSETGDSIPLADILMMRAEGEITGGDATTKATGTVRFYFKDAVNFFVSQSFRASPLGVVNYSVDALAGPSGTFAIVSDGVEEVPRSTCTISGVDLSGEAALSKGNRITDGVNYWTIYTDPVFASGDTTFKIREDGTDTLINPTFLSGTLESDMEIDDEVGLYYWDLSVTCTSTGAGGNQDDETLFSRTSNEESYYSEGYYLQAGESELSFSPKERAYLALSRYVNDDKDLRLDSTSYVIRITYDYAEGYGDIQGYAEDPDNRPVGEDILIRHMMPSLVIMSLTTDGDVDDVEEAVVDFVMAVDPTADFEISDMVTELYGSGVTYVKMPLQCAVMTSGRDRRWSATHITDRHSTSRVNHYLADTDSITASKDS